MLPNFSTFSQIIVQSDFRQATLHSLVHISYFDHGTSDSTADLVRLISSLPLTFLSLSLPSKVLLQNHHVFVNLTHPNIMNHYIPRNRPSSATNARRVPVLAEIVVTPDGQEYLEEEDKAHARKMAGWEAIDSARHVAACGWDFEMAMAMAIMELARRVTWVYLLGWWKHRNVETATYFPCVTIIAAHKGPPLSS